MNCAPGTIDLECINGSCFDRCSRSLVSCDIQLNDATYRNGGTVVAKHLRLVNGGALPVAVEVGLWFEGPTTFPMTYVNVGADGSFVL